MSSDTPPSLQQVQHLQQALAAMRAERDRMAANAAQWRQRYETEAQQRRTEQTQAQGEIQSLRQEREKLLLTVAHLQGHPLKAIAPSPSPIGNEPRSDDNNSGDPNHGDPHHNDPAVKPEVNTDEVNTSDANTSEVKVETQTKDLGVIDGQTLLREKAELELALAEERKAHQRTRSSLINALGDALQKKR